MFIEKKISNGQKHLRTQNKNSIPLATWENITFLLRPLQHIVLNRTILVRKGRTGIRPVSRPSDQVFLDTIADSGKSFIIVGQPFMF
jgi:hypothetical protein